MRKTYFISFEGIDGSGKDTQLLELAKAIRNDDGYPFGDKYSTIWITREPTKITEAGKSISTLIRERQVTGEEAAKLFITDRIEHSRMIEEQLNKSHVLISRQDLSTLSYQMTQGIDFEILYEMHKYGQSDGTLVPDITLVFDLPVEVAFERMGKRDSVKECFEERDFQEQLKKNQDFCIKELRKRGRTVLVINADQPVEAVAKEMLEKIAEVVK